jgi:ketosteroid isomerase-like protein
MSQQNVEVVRDIYSSWAPGSSPADSNLLHPDIEWVNPSDALESGTRIATMRGSGSTSGIEIKRRHGSVWTIRDGKAVRFQWFYEPAEALEAVGLSQ